MQATRVGHVHEWLVAVFAPELTREAVLEAIRKRRCYAATNERILGYMTVPGPSWARNTSSCRRAAAIAFAFTAPRRSTRSGDQSGRVLETWREGGKVCEWALTDAPRGGRSLLLRQMKQKDGEMAWLSPVFVHVARPADQGSARVLLKNFVRFFVLVLVLVILIVIVLSIP